MAAGEVPNGLEDMKVAILNSSDVPGSSVDVPGAQTFNFTIDSDSNDVRGDDQVIAVVRTAKTLSGSIAVARVNLVAMAAMVGGTSSSTGTTPNVIVTLDESAAAVSRYFQCTAQANAYDTSGAAYRVVVKKLSVTGGPSETLDQQAFDSPTLDVSGVGVSNILLTRSNYETKVALT